MHNSPFLAPTLFRLLCCCIFAHFLFFNVVESTIATFSSNWLFLENSLHILFHLLPKRNRLLQSIMRFFTSLDSRDNITETLYSIRVTWDKPMDLSNEESFPSQCVRHGAPAILISPHFTSFECIPIQFESNNSSALKIHPLLICDTLTCCAVLCSHDWRRHAHVQKAFIFRWTLYKIRNMHWMTECMIKCAFCRFSAQSKWNNERHGKSIQNECNEYRSSFITVRFSTWRCKYFSNTNASV